MPFSWNTIKHQHNIVEKTVISLKLLTFSVAHNWGWSVTGRGTGHPRDICVRRVHQISNSIERQQCRYQQGVGLGQWRNMVVPRKQSNATRIFHSLGSVTHFLISYEVGIIFFKLGRWGATNSGSVPGSKRSSYATSLGQTFKLRRWPWASIKCYTPLSLCTNWAGAAQSNCLCPASIAHSAHTFVVFIWAIPASQSSVYPNCNFMNKRRLSCSVRVLILVRGKFNK